MIVFTCDTQWRDTVMAGGSTAQALDAPHVPGGVNSLSSLPVLSTWLALRC